jgi:hypothetical protein
MSTPFDRFAKLREESDCHRLDLIKTELALCFTFSNIAARKYETGSQESASKSMANAEKAYETVIQLLSDPKHSRRLTGEESQDITAELERLRERLDGLNKEVQEVMRNDHGGTVCRTTPAVSAQA